MVWIRGNFSSNSRNVGDIPDCGIDRGGDASPKWSSPLNLHMSPSTFVQGSLRQVVIVDWHCFVEVNYRLTRQKKMEGKEKKREKKGKKDPSPKNTTPTKHHYRNLRFSDRTTDNSRITPLVLLLQRQGDKRAASLHPASCIGRRPTYLSAWGSLHEERNNVPTFFWIVGFLDRFRTDDQTAWFPVPCAMVWLLRSP